MFSSQLFYMLFSCEHTLTETSRMYDIFLATVAHPSWHIKSNTIQTKGFLTFDWGHGCNKKLSYCLQRVKQGLGQGQRLEWGYLTKVEMHEWQEGEGVAGILSLLWSDILWSQVLLWEAGFTFNLLECITEFPSEPKKESPQRRVDMARKNV